MVLRSVIELSQHEADCGCGMTLLLTAAFTRRASDLCIFDLAILPAGCIENDLVFGAASTRSLTEISLPTYKIGNRFFRLTFLFNRKKISFQVDLKQDLHQPCRPLHSARSSSQAYVHPRLYIPPTSPAKTILTNPHVSLQASGSLGSALLTALSSNPNFEVAILTRASSTSRSRFPPHIPVLTVSDAFTLVELTEAFRGQDAVINALSTEPVTRDDLGMRFVDACIAASVKRLITGDFGADNLNTEAQATVPVYKAKGEVIEYLKKKTEQGGVGLTWTALGTGSWLDW